MSLKNDEVSEGAEVRWNASHFEWMILASIITKCQMTRLNAQVLMYLKFIQLCQVTMNENQM